MALSPVRRALAAVAATALVSAGLVLGTAGAANAATRTVGPTGTYPTITLALAAADPGDTITVQPGTYIESFTVTEAVQITSADPITTIIQGQVTLSAPALIQGFTLQSSDTTDPYTGADPLWITAGGAGSTVFANTIQRGLHGIYMSDAIGTEAAPTVIASNSFYQTGFGNTGSLWIAGSAHVLAVDNFFYNVLPNDDDAVAINLVSGSHHVTIRDNNIVNFGNAIVVISVLPGIGTTTHVVIEGNIIEQTRYSALYFGGNNITDVTIRGNEIDGVTEPGRSAIQFAAGYTGDTDAWITPGAPDLDRILIESNILGPAGYGINVGAGVLLENTTSILSRANTFTGIVTNSIIGSQSGPCVTTTDDVFNGSAFILNVCVANTPPKPVLAATGTDVTLPIGIAGALTLAGAIALMIAGRRRKV
jgi:hypothetical protein